jgi:SAM-dependent methyltransferase
MANLHTTFAGSIPEYYDRCVGPAQFGPFGAALAALLPADPGGDILEIACGTGIVTQELRRRLTASRRLVASDLSRAMIDYASAKLSSLPGIEWREADAMNLPFADREFAAAVCSFGFMFVPDKPRAFREARRVLRDGGRLYFSVWDRIEENPMAHAFARAIESRFPDDPEIRFRLPWSMHDASELRKLLVDAAFEPLHIEKKRIDVTGDPRSIATGQVRGTPRGALLEKKGLSMDEAIDIATDALEKLSGAKDFHSHGQALFVEARVSPA